MLLWRTPVAGFWGDWADVAARVGLLRRGGHVVRPGPSDLAWDGATWALCAATCGFWVRVRLADCAAELRGGSPTKTEGAAQGCLKVALKLPPSCLFCSVDYTTAAPFPAGPAGASPRPRHREKAFSSSWRANREAPPERLSGSRTLAALLLWRTPVAGFWGDWADVAPVLACFAGVAMLPNLAGDGATWGLCAPTCGFLSGVGCLGRGTGPGIRRFFGHAAWHRQANWRRDGDGGEGGFPMGAERANGRTRRKIRPQDRDRRLPSWLSHRNGEETARAVRIRAHPLLRCTCGRRAGAGLRRPPEVVVVH